MARSEKWWFGWFCFLVIGAGVIQSPARAGWIWMEDEGFMSRSTGRDQGVQEPAMQRAETLFYQENYEQALDMLEKIRRKGRSKYELEKASLLRARTLYQMGAYIESYEAFQAFTRNYAGTKYRDWVIRYQLDIGFQLMKGKQYRRFAGIPLISAASDGERIVRNLLSRYPYKSFSHLYQFRLANLYYDRKSYQAAAEEYEFLLENYEQSSWRPHARFLAGDSYFRSVEGISYDLSKLSDARSHFRTFVKSYPERPDVERAKQRLRKINQLLAERKFQTADWYERTGRRSGAIFYFKEITSLYPGTDWAERALTRLIELDAEVSDELKQRVETHDEPVILDARDQLQ